MTGLKRRVADEDAKQKLSREITQPAQTFRGSGRSNEEILDEAVAAFKKKVHEGSSKDTHDA